VSLTHRPPYTPQKHDIHSLGHSASLETFDKGSICSCYQIKRQLPVYPARTPAAVPTEPPQHYTRLHIPTVMNVLIAFIGHTFEVKLPGRIFRVLIICFYFICIMYFIPNLYSGLTGSGACALTHRRNQRGRSKDRCRPERKAF
jgi:hypothetical protein